MKTHRSFFALVALLAFCGAAPSHAQGIFDAPAILTAVQQGDFAWAQKLLLGGSNPNSTDERGVTPLILAARRNDVALVRLLLEHRASPARKDKSGQTPLFHAAEKGGKDVIEALLSKSARVDDANDQGVTPLMAAAHADNAEAATALLKAGANTKKQDFTGRDALTWAQESRARHVLPLLEAKR
ncbi:MAG: ankyrin repeat protein [Rhodospirillales bacterium]|nr:ankyrin repeat protein [Rhodospirillales bacterium]